jgi:hypothetical protein
MKETTQKPPLCICDIDKELSSLEKTYEKYNQTKAKTFKDLAELIKLIEK